ncbi:MAG: DUF1003 domain-containing protein [Burkholderiaceae bacterium]
MRKASDIAQKWLGADYDKLDERTRNVARHIASGTHISRRLGSADGASDSVGQRAADVVARFGGSWTFIGLFLAVMLVWVVINTAVATGWPRVFDPYPYILLNLVLSMLAAIQAPIILMSNNRQSEKDRAHAEHDYEVNLKAEMEIMLLHEKLDQLRQQQWTDLLAMQHQQIALLAKLLDTMGGPQARSD